MSDDTIETGLVAAAVTMHDAELPPETDPIMVAAVTALAIPRAQMPDGWTLHSVAELVRDVAQNMYELPYILNKHKLTPEQFATIETNEFFKSALAAEVQTWNSANSIQRRLQLESAIAMEHALPTVAARLSKATEPLADVVALLKILSEIAGTSGAKAQTLQQGSGEKFKIVINLGADITAREATRTVEIQSLSEGYGEKASLPEILQIPRSA